MDSAIEPFQQIASGGYNLKETLTILQGHVDQALSLKSNPEGQNAIQQLYRNEVLPHLLQLRRLNRVGKDSLATKYQKLKEWNQKLIDLQQTCDSLSFESSCLKAEVNSVRDRASQSQALTNGHDNEQAMGDEPLGGDGIEIFDVDAVAKLDHETRMRILDEEEDKRRSLRAKLSQLSEETKNIELSCLQTTNQLNQVKPYIRQLVEKVEPSFAPMTVDSQNGQ